jgi:hypothetical protein
MGGPTSPPSKRNPEVRNIFSDGTHQQQNTTFTKADCLHIHERYSLLNQDCQNKLINIDKSANPEHVIIPILGSIFLFPILVITTICCIRVRNIRAMEKRIDDLAKKNRISKGRVPNIHIYAHFPCCVGYFCLIFQDLA